MLGKQKQLFKMKRLFLLITIMVYLGLGNLDAQTDGFFNSNYKPLSEETEKTPIEISTKNNVPLTSGLLLLAGMGLIYLKMKKKVS